MAVVDDGEPVGAEVTDPIGFPPDGEAVLDAEVGLVVLGVPGDAPEQAPASNKAAAPTMIPTRDRRIIASDRCQPKGAGTRLGCSSQPPPR